jgi:hypothetical protein
MVLLTPLPGWQASLKIRLTLVRFQKVAFTLWFRHFNDGAGRTITHDAHELQEQEYHCGGGFEHLHNDVVESAAKDGC